MLYQEWRHKYSWNNTHIFTGCFANHQIFTPRKTTDQVVSPFRDHDYRDHQGNEHPVGHHEIVKSVPGLMLPIKTMFDVSDDVIMVITAYPLKRR